MSKSHIYKNGEVLAGKYKIIRHIDSGGAGQVFEVMQNGIGLPRALKALLPKYADDPEYIKPLKQEIRVLSNLTHQNIVKIIDCSSSEEGEKFFFVMEYINGPNLRDAIINGKDLDKAIDLLYQLFDAVCYLHERRILHCDIKPANVRIFKDEVSGREHVKLLDLGAAKIIRDVNLFSSEFSLSPETEKLTQLMGTRFYAPRECQRDLNTNSISQAELFKLFPYMDLYGLGATMAECLSQLSLKDHIDDSLEILLKNPHAWIDIEDDRWLFLEGLIKQLLLKRDSSLQFKSIEAAREAFLRITPSKGLPTQVPELTDISSIHSIRAPDGMRHFTERTYKLITHPTFQRLQKLNQLSFVDLIYPWGRHSRFSHSLDVFKLARQVTLALLKDRTFRLLIEPDDIKTFLCAALLHDVGHFPLAHVIEDIPSVKVDSALVQNFLERPVTGHKSLAEVTQALWGIEASTIQHMVNRQKYSKELNPAKRFLRNLLDGPLDIDKMAYVQADSTHTGVPFGKGADVDFLISSFIALSKLNRPSFEESEPEIALGVQSKGAEAAVGLISARASLYGRVYWHHTNRSIMAVIQYVARRVFDREDGKSLGFERYRDETWNMSEYEALSYLVARLPHSDEFSPLKNPAIGILDGSRTLHKRLASYSDTAKEHENIRNVFQAMVAASPDVLEDWRTKLKIRFADIAKIRPLNDYDVLIDVPRVQKKNDAQTNVYVTGAYEPKTLRKLSEIHPVAKSLHEQFVENVSKARIFVSPRLRDILRERGRIHDAIASITEIIVG